MKQFQDRVALITGGTAGIGRATALAFAREGAKVVITGRREKEGGEVVDEIVQLDGEALFIKTDVAKEADVKAMVEKTVATFGRLDFAFNNAGVEQPITPLTEQTEELYDEVMNINVKGVWLSMKHEIPAMLKTGGGVIINTSSISGVLGVTGGIELYVASKHAVIGLTRSAALEFARQNIRVNAVAPAAIQTRMFDAFTTDPKVRQFMENAHPVGRIGQPDEVAGAVIYLCSDRAAFITGQTLAIDGGFTIQ